MKGCLSVYIIIAAMAVGVIIVSVTADYRSEYLKSSEIIAKTIVARMEMSGLKRLAIVDFNSVDNIASGAGRFLADRLIADVTAVPMSIQVINRKKMDQIFEEIGLKEVGVLDRETVIEQGNMIGIDAIVLGTYKVTKNVWGTPTNLSLSIELINLEKGVTAYANTINIVGKHSFPEVVPYCE
ncbi:MAG TPA: hypothetical protein PKC76_13180 [Saprospiraceae bacterium]|nr:hypothetical protein [Saprospiraceae bacterium]HMP25085.1 hypothetical protein [Saprospiraceae bacterium]